jgi:hypothetical protein
MAVRTASRGRVVRAAMTPGLVGFMASSKVRRNPYRLFRLLQRIDPIHSSPLGLWVLTGHSDVATALRDPRLGNQESKADLAALKLGIFDRFFGRKPFSRETSPFLRMFSELMLFRDPPDHTRLRALVAKAFTPRRVEALEPRVQHLVNEILDRVTPDGGMDVMRDLAYPLPARVICELVGVPPDDVPLILRHAPALAIGLDPSPMRPPEAVERANHATDELVAYMSDLIAHRRREPGEDMLSALIAAEEGGETLSHDELIATVLLLLLAGHETTANLVGNGLVALARHPGELRSLQEDESVEKSAVEELLRYDSPVQMTQRITLEPIEIGGQTVPAGRIIVLLIAAANRDPSAFDEPGQLDLRRLPNPHLAFGGGAHFCIGAPLARLEGRIVLSSFVRRFPNFRITRDGVVRRKSFTIRGFSRLEVAWS